jgi:hypothetical protein
VLVVLFIVGLAAVIAVVVSRRGSDVQEVEGFARTQSALEATVRRTQQENEPPTETAV